MSDNETTAPAAGTAVETETEQLEISQARARPNTDVVVTGEQREGADAVALALIGAGIDIAFGYTGGATPHLTRSFLPNGIEMFGARTEISAAWISAGYNRIKRRAASVVVTWNVGALHAAPAVYGATSDGTPLLFITIDNPPAMEAREGLQDAVQVYSALKPISKYIKKVTDAADYPVIIRQAVKEASTGKFGAATLVMAQTTMFQKTGLKIEPLVLPSPPSPSANDVDRTWELLKQAERPVLYVGAGVHLADASQPLREFVEITGIPVVSTSWGGRGLLPDRHLLYIGPSGAFGWRSANSALADSDLWITVGTSYSQMSTGSWSLHKPETVVQVDVDQFQLGKIFQPTLAIQSDAKLFLQALSARAKADGHPEAAGTDWVDQVQRYKRDSVEQMQAWADEKVDGINQYRLIRTISETVPEDTVVVGDSGGNAFGLYRAFEYKTPTQVPTGGHYMSLGAGLPVAIGVKLALPERTVLCYHGDGGFYYDLSELATLTRHNLKVIVVIDNNHSLLANRSTMKMLGYDNPWCEVPEDTDFVGVARGFGVDGERVETDDQIAPALERALESKGSYLLDVQTDSSFRIRRAMTDIIPIVGDRTPKKGHLETVLEGSWPS
jgi:acetolactate synthase-1/2/3 large subunit